MWMSATAGPADLVTADHGQPVRVVELAASDLADERLAKRLAATRVVRRASLPADPELYPAALAGALAAWHVPGTATIAVLNTAERARAVYDALEETAHAADLLLLHARLRPRERSVTAALLDARLPACGPHRGGHPGARSGRGHLLPDDVHRVRAMEFDRGAGGQVQPGWRRARRGPAVGAAAARPGACGPLRRGGRGCAAERALAALEAAEVTSGMLCDYGHELAARREPRHPVLTRTDLLRLFDTAPDPRRGWHRNRRDAMGPWWRRPYGPGGLAVLA